MKVYNNEIVIQRGETFTMHKIIVNPDGSPYIFDANIDNQYILLSLSSTRFDMSEKFIANWWLDLSNIKKFKNVVALSHSGVFNDNDPPKYNNKIDYDNLYVDNNQNYCYYKEAVKENNVVVEPAGWKPYSCVIIKSFTKQDINSLLGQNYEYSLTLVSGESMLTRLQEISRQLDISISNKSKNELYDEILLIEPEYVQDITADDLDKPLYNIDREIPILLPEKFTVSTNLRRRA